MGMGKPTGRFEVEDFAVHVLREGEPIIDFEALYGPLQSLIEQLPEQV